MSISSALSNALSGLTASSRAAGVVSSNLANVLTEGYATRQLEIVSQTGGPRTGVTIVGITRNIDQALLGDRRLADSAVAHSDTLLRFTGQLEQAVGTPDDPASLSGRVTAFENSLITAASRPEARIACKPRFRARVSWRRFYPTYQTRYKIAAPRRIMRSTDRWRPLTQTLSKSMS